MRVTFDDQIFSFQKYGGVSRYFSELISEFRRNPAHDVDVDTPFRFAVSEHLIAADPARYRRPPTVRYAQRPGAVRLANTLMHQPGRRVPEILHHTYYIPKFLDRPAAARVCTIYDMIPELLPELFPEGSPHLAKHEYVEASDGVLCISETTKADLERLWGPLDKPVEVTPLAVSGEYFGARPDESAYRYFAYVGRRNHYKNFDVVLDALAGVIGEDPTLRLVLAGGEPLSPEEIARIDELGLRDHVERRSVPDEEMPGFYAGAIALVWSSSYEGFGLPIVEAFAAGCPVVVADTPCSIEVSGGASPVFSVGHADSLADLLLRLAGDSEAHAHWSRLAMLRAQDFSWERTATLTAAAYRRIAAEAGR